MSIRPARVGDLRFIKRMCDEYIGADYYTLEELERAFRDADQYFTVYANEDDVPVAFIYMFTAELSEAAGVLKAPEGLLRQFAAPDAGRVGIFKTTCTEKSCRRHGILFELIQSCENTFRELGIKTIFLNALKLPSGKVPAENGLGRAQFSGITELSHPWSDIESTCPYCGKQHCMCNAVLYYKEIDRYGRENEKEPENQ